MLVKIISLKIFLWDYFIFWNQKFLNNEMCKMWQTDLSKTKQNPQKRRAHSHKHCLGNSTCFWCFVTNASICAPRRNAFMQDSPVSLSPPGLILPSPFTRAPPWCNSIRFTWFGTKLAHQNCPKQAVRRSLCSTALFSALSEGLFPKLHLLTSLTASVGTLNPFICRSTTNLTP